MPWWLLSFSIDAGDTKRTYVVGKTFKLGTYIFISMIILQKVMMCSLQKAKNKIHVIFDNFCCCKFVMTSNLFLLEIKMKFGICRPFCTNISVTWHNIQLLQTCMDSGLSLHSDLCPRWLQQLFNLLKTVCIMAVFKFLPLYTIEIRGFVFFALWNQNGKWKVASNFLHSIFFVQCWCVWWQSICYCTGTVEFPSTVP